MLLLALVALLFFCSGASALIYQVLWLRKLGLVFGVTVYAASTVWASFMFGLAVGSLLSGRLADRVRRPLVWFGVAEALIAVSAVATPVALSVVMGATLPLVVKSSSFRSSDLGQRMALLYASNTAGAIVGTLVSGLYLIPRYGIQRSFIVAALLNLCVAAVAIVAGLTRVSPSNRSAVDADADVRSVSMTYDPSMTASARRVVLLVFAVSGFASLALEVIWFRVLVLLVRPTVYGFAADAGDRVGLS